MNKTVKNLLALLFWLLVWQLGAAAVGNPLLLPGPGEVLACLGGLMTTPAFWGITLTSLGRILLGAALGILLGVVLGVLACASGLLDALIAPVMTVVQAAPVASFAILVLIWLERDFVPVLICAMMVLPVVWSNVCAGIRGVEVQLLEMAKVYRLTLLQKLRRIYVPSVMPYFRAACASALGLGWKAGIAAEVLTVPKFAMGRMIADSKLYLMIPELFAWTLAVVALSLLLQKLMLKLLAGRDRNA